MSRKVTTTITCDGLGFDGRRCGITFRAESGPGSALNAARADGWVTAVSEVTGTRHDLCPACAGQATPHRTKGNDQ